MASPRRGAGHDMWNVVGRVSGQSGETERCRSRRLRHHPPRGQPRPPDPPADRNMVEIGESWSLSVGELTERASASAGAGADDVSFA